MPRPLLALLLALTLAVAAVAQTPQTPQAPSADLAPRYQAWLDEVTLLISPKERAAFLGLQKDYQRDAFIRRFWDVRDPFPQTPANEFRERWERNAEAARKRLSNLADDRARVEAGGHTQLSLDNCPLDCMPLDARARLVLLNGEPREVFPVRCDVLLPVEIWTFPGTDRIHGDFTVVFVARGSSYRLWSPNEGIQELLSLDLRARVQEPSRALAAIAELCPRGEDASARIAEAIDWGQAESRLHLIPHPGEEWLSTFASYSTDVPEGAAPFPARLDLTFPGRFGSRTVVQGLVSVPREAVRPEKLEGSPEAFYSFLVDGEVLYKGELFEHFRYRFTLPQSALPQREVAGQEIPVVFQRYLRPGSYSLIVKIEDTSEKRFFREQRELEVPAVDAAPVTAATTTAAAAPSAASPAPSPQAALAEANAQMNAGL